ncbi:M36 family metallopeptidase [Micromonospora sp. DR5-3]|uniref:M36 family metallopeptidase n=1 Tax=unclassified Micromonospora TaxID=2617518 RepID=UPI0011DC5BE8|nr:MULTISPECIES: M36 family metallopeptidase [unclassified Micromonospora]MCW3816137.1 M36 family metallopeptidase [Micromonospora sp. DR5-3]TYC22136.1 metalloprotease [Micromonospora sp. MP36]
MLSTTLVASVTSLAGGPAWAEPDGAGAKNPIFLTGPNEGAANDIAVSYVRAHPDDYGVRAADVSDLAVASSYTSRHNGVTHVNLAQRHRDLEVFGATATVSVARDGSVVFVGDSLVSGLSDKASGTASLDAVEAVQAAADALDLAEPASPKVMSRSAGAAQRTMVSGAGISDQPIPAKLGWQPTDDGLRLAWQLVIDDSSDVHLWNASIDAQTGELLNADDWTHQDSPAELAATLGRREAPATKVATASIPATKVSPPNPADDGSSYRVFEFPKGDPNDGPQTLVTNPADGDASPYGWHDTDGAPGAEYTITRGNNAHAYTDRDANNQIDPGSSAEGGAGLTFNFPADLNEHPQTYTQAAVVNQFYWCNIVHDLSYRYGFDEASGNFQVNNYGRGGTGGDDVQCEAHDGSGQNNANFSTPALDGGRPRMQMFLWPGNQFGLPNTVTIDGGSAASTYEAEYARFTPAPTSAGFAGEVVLVNDGVGATGDGCTAYSLTQGAIAVVDRTSGCNFYTQVANAEKAGAAAVVVVNNVAGAPAVMSGSMSPAVGIPAVMVSQADGNRIKAGLPASGRVQRNLARPAMRDASFRSETIFHEYGHGVSNRLTGGPTVNCLTGEEQMGEGWSDFLAITALLNPAIDDPEKARGYGQYALFEASRVGGGIRPRPYSRNMEIQPFTYDSIKTGGWLDGTSLAAPHGIGHGWAAVLWDMTWDLVDRHGFNPNVYEGWNTGGNNLALQLVIDGLKMQGCGPGFVTGRNAIIAADAALTGGENACTLWASFARRGLGYSAVQGTTGRNDNAEAFDTHPSCRGDFVGRSAQPALNTVIAGDAAPMKFQLSANRGLDILASGSPYSRLVDCGTLKTINPDGSVTPRPTPVAARNPGGSSMSVSANGQYNYPWKTDPAWAGTCREFVLTLDNGFQYRAYFKFTS